jgi:hypothetical protein
LGKLDRVDLTGLALHERAVARDLEMLGVPAANWPGENRGLHRPTGPGCSGCWRRHERHRRRRQPDVQRNTQYRRGRALKAGQEGPWLTFARDGHAALAQDLDGPALGVPSLTFRAWYEAKYGLNAWEALYKIHNRTWVEYLSWLQQVLALPVTAWDCGWKRSSPAGPVRAGRAE